VWIVAGLCFVGLAVSVVWILMVRRSAYISHVVETQMKEVEEHLATLYSIPRPLQVYTRFCEAIAYSQEKRSAMFNPRHYRLGGFRLSYLWTFIGIVFALAWIALMIFAWRVLPELATQAGIQ
jgi:hypothetical protein